MKFNYKDIAEYYDYDYWNTYQVKSGYIDMLGSIGGYWHDQACAWFDSVIPVRGRHLFDAGCGLGHFMLAFEKLGAFSYGCDVSDYSRIICGPHFGDRFFHTSIEDLFGVVPNSFDIIFTSATFEHIKPSSVQLCLNNLISITKPGGLLYIEVDTKPSSERDFPEESHISIQPWDAWLDIFKSLSFTMEPLPGFTAALKSSSAFPGFPLPDWNFMVFKKPIK